MKKFFLILLSISLFSCVNSIYENRVSDKEEAEIITNQFFDYLKKSDYEKVSELMSPRFFEASPKEKLIEVLKNSDSKLGLVKDYEVIEWKTSVIEGKKKSATYVFLYNVNFANAKGKIKVSLEKNEKDKIQIIGYNVSSDALLN